MRPTRRALALALLAPSCLASSLSAASPATSPATSPTLGQDRTELLLVGTAGCPWCARWDREIGPIYPRTDEGRRAPLRRVEIRGFSEALALREPLRYTPTFLLVRNGGEVGRITGYQGADAFWGLLDVLLAQLGRAEGTLP